MGATLATAFLLLLYLLPFSYSIFFIQVFFSRSFRSIHRKGWLGNDLWSIGWMKISTVIIFIRRIGQKSQTTTRWNRAAIIYHVTRSCGWPSCDARESRPITEHHRASCCFNVFLFVFPSNSVSLLLSFAPFLIPYSWRRNNPITADEPPRIWIIPIILSRIRTSYSFASSDNFMNLLQLL